MIHVRARRLLPALLDASLPMRRERALHAHLVRCARCRRELRELETVEALVDLLPRGLVPLEAIDESHLASLARWFPAPAMPRRPGFAAVGMAAAVVGLAFTLSLAQWIPHSADARAGTSFRPDHPEIAYLPMGLR